MKALVQVENLGVIARAEDGGTKAIVSDVSFTIARGEVLALIGESGSGKTTTALALMGYLRRGCEIKDGTVRLGDTIVTTLNPRDLRALRGRRVSYVAQSAAASFNPAMRIMDQVLEPTRIHNTLPRQQAEAAAVALFRELALPDPETIGSRYPHQVSGGQLQRLMAAMALITDPELVIFDEPTTALDVTTQIDVLRAFKRVIGERGIAAVYVSHDLAVVAQMADQVVVLQGGEVREAGSTEQILLAPGHDYTRQLLAAAQPVRRVAGVTSESDEALLTVDAVTAGYGQRGPDGMPAITVLRDVSLAVRRGMALGIIGESGSGKSTLARAIAGLVPTAAGTIRLGGTTLPGDLAQRSRDQFRRIQIVFQNADTALNPAHSVERILARPLAFYHGLNAKECRQRVRTLLDHVHLPAAIAQQPCYRLSGGQKQRVNLARALAAEPDLLLCDEVTSALDSVVAAAILDLFVELRRELQVSYVFISHDIATVRAVCDEILVLYAGRKIEEGRREHFETPPYHPYTQVLMSSVPELELGWLERAGYADKVYPVHAKDPLLCPFLERCPVRLAGTCSSEPPPWHQLPSGNAVLCHHAETGLLADPMGGAVQVPSRDRV